jgi:hypothetical protein
MKHIFNTYYIISFYLVFIWFFIKLNAHYFVSNNERLFNKTNLCIIL